MLEVIEVLARKRRDVKILLIGDIPSPVRDRLLRVAGNRVEMPGFVEHDLPPQFIQKARICSFPQDRSLVLGGSLKLIEYSASGRPVVATNVDESFPLKESEAGIVTELDAEASLGSWMMTGLLKNLQEKVLNMRENMIGIRW